MGTEKTLNGFTYTPRTGTLDGVVDRYRFEASTGGRIWTVAAEGEFCNLRANPVEQTVPFAPAKARHFRFTALHALEKNTPPSPNSASSRRSERETTRQARATGMSAASRHG